MFTHLGQTFLRGVGLRDGAVLSGVGVFVLQVCCKGMSHTANVAPKKVLEMYCSLIDVRFLEHAFRNAVICTGCWGEEESYARH
jgi:hypothetical protein